MRTEGIPPYAIYDLHGKGEMSGYFPEAPQLQQKAQPRNLYAFFGKLVQKPMRRS